MHRSFRFGIVIANAPSPEAFVTLARRAEELSYSTLLMPDRIITGLAVRTALMRNLTIPVAPSWLLRPMHRACQRLLPVAGISCRNRGPGSGVLALHTARLSVFSRPLSPASPPPYRPDSRRPQ